MKLVAYVYLVPRLKISGSVTPLHSLLLYGLGLIKQHRQLQNVIVKPLHTQNYKICKPIFERTLNFQNMGFVIERLFHMPLYTMLKFNAKILTKNLH